MKSILRMKCLLRGLASSMVMLSLLANGPPHTRSLLRLLCVLGVMACFASFTGNAAQTDGGSTSVLQETSAAADKVGTAAANTAKDLWARIDEARLKNRTPDELAAWVIVGLLVGAVAGMGTTLKPTGLGKLGRVLLGLTGAFVGGIIVHVAQFDFGWGPVLIRYEELFFSLLGAILIVVIGRLIAARMKDARKIR